MSRHALPHARMRCSAKLAALTACLAVIAVVIPAVPAAAHKWTPRGQARDFAVSATGGSAHEPARWDPCRAIGYRVNRSQAGRGAVKDVKTAIRRLSRATGLTFVYRGTTTSIPQAKWTEDAYPADTQLIIAWIRPSQSTLMPLRAGTHESLAGRGGSWHVPATDRAGRSLERYDRGFALLNAGIKFPAGFKATGRSGSRGLELMHELGHVVGLDHPRQGGRQQVMYPVLTPRPGHWGRGDLAGLRLVGAAGGCLTDVS